MLALLILLLASAGSLFFLVGYPLLLRVYPWRFRPAIRKDPNHQPTITVLLAVFNGEAFIARKLESLLAQDYPRHLVQILIVSDGSTDRTHEIVRQYAHQGAVLLTAPHGGKAAAINFGLPHATGEILVFTDVRQPFQPNAIRELAANFADPSVGAVTGELRILNPGQGEQADMDLYWRYELWVRQLHSRIDSLFNTTGCIYAMRRSLAAALPPNTIADDAVLPLGAFHHGSRVIFDPAAIAHDQPIADGREFRRRLRTLAGLWQVYAQMPHLLWRPRMRFHFICHKLSRLLLPWLLLATVIATYALPPGPLRNMLTAGEILYAAIVLIDWIIPRSWPLKRLTSPARTFFLMNLAAAMSIAVFFVSPRSLWGHAHVQPPQSARPS
jgi:cellulose synthase/poly-beta-1,6-N-acetylglucosamine synthase-like glycosyltransferase